MSTYSEFLKNFPHFSWDHKPDQILSKTKEMIASKKLLYNKAVSKCFDDISFDSIMKPFAFHEANDNVLRNMLSLYEFVSTNKEVRDASNVSSKNFAEFDVELNMRRDIYDLLVKIRNKSEQLEGENKRLLDKLILDRERSGVHLDEELRSQIEVLDKKISNLCLDFTKNTNEENSSFAFSLEELEGMDQDFLDSLEKEGDLFYVTLKYPHVIPLLKMCKISSTRRKIETEFNSRCKDANIPILQEVIELRDRRAKVLGFPTHVDYVSQIQMSKSAANISEFLHSLADKLKKLGRKNLDRLLELKKEECIERGLEFDGKINAWDSSYYQRVVEERDYSVDHNIVREYFPFDYVTAKLFEIYQHLLHLRFKKVEDAVTWHSEVSLYAVLDECDNEKLIGYFYLDIFPRPGKYGHAMCYPLQESCLSEDGRHLALGAMVANFTKPLPDKPSLLTHVEVETYFHEFGHVMHLICSKPQYINFSGMRVETDFVEAPSQMLENWVWCSESLKKISSHYKTNQELSDDLITKLCASRKANTALFNLRQISLALLDYTLHTSSKADSFEVLKRLYNELVGIQITEGTNMAASFGHLCGGYDGKYYGYLWSKVYSSDMFCSRFEKAVFDASTGLDYRRKILEPGATKDASQLLRDFLGRDPSKEPFLKLIGAKEN